MANDPQTNNALKAFYAKHEGKWEKAEADASVKLPPGTYKMTPVKALFRPKPNKPTVMQTFWVWKVLAGEFRDKLYNEYNDIDPEGDYFQIQLSILKSRVARLGYDPNEIKLSEVQESFNVIVADNLTVETKITEKTTVSVKDGKTYTNQTLWIQKVIEDESYQQTDTTDDEEDPNDPLSEASQTAGHTPDPDVTASVERQEAAVTVQAGGGQPTTVRRPGRPAKAAAETPATPALVQEPEPPKAAETPPTVYVADDQRVIVEPHLGMKVKYLIFNKANPAGERVSGVINNIPDDENEPMEARRDGTLKNDVLDDDSEYVAVLD